MKGVIFDIKRFAVHDGPGIRTTVFLQGCPLGCWWCHNPEGQRNNAGNKVSVAEVMDEVIKDSIFYEESNGGVTFSGGEPLHQSGFLSELLKGCKKEGFHTCVDTSGYATKESIDLIMDDTDLFLFDLKHTDDTVHRKYTGVSNSCIIDNLKYLAGKKKEIILRFPVIPGINDSTDNISEMLKLLKEIKGIFEIDLLPYHRTGSHKYKKINMEYKLSIDENSAAGRAGSLKKEFEENGYHVKIGG